MSQRTLNRAVLECWTAYQQTYATETGKGASSSDAYEAGKMAYRQAMPYISDQSSIRDFVACVTQGMVLRLIPNDDGGRLIYAANVSAGFLRQEEEAAPKLAWKMAQQQQSSSKVAETAIASPPAVEA